MRVLVDTSVWSLALRKKNLSDDESSILKELTELIKELRGGVIDAGNLSAKFFHPA
jgi:hypothetical protein